MLPWMPLSMDVPGARGVVVRYTGHCFVETFLACQFRSPHRQAIEAPKKGAMKCAKEVKFLETSIETASQDSH